MNISDYFSATSTKDDARPASARPVSREPRLVYPDPDSPLRKTLIHPSTGVVIPSAQYELYDALCQIPTGRITTYASLAKHLTGHENGARSIGHRLSGNLNLFAPVVPCHRVIKSNLKIGGFGSETSLTSPQVLEKLALLRREGVYFDTKSKLIDRGKLWSDFNKVGG